MCFGMGRHRLKPLYLFSHYLLYITCYFGAEKAITDGSAEKVAEDALGGGSLDDWVQEAW